MSLSRKDCRTIRAVLQARATGFRYADVARWLRRAGFEAPVRKDGSHRVWVHSSGRRVVLVERGHGELLPAYVKEAARVILEIGACTG